jgi:hypothetical protein
MFDFVSLLLLVRLLLYSLGALCFGLENWVGLFFGVCFVVVVAAKTTMRCT